MPLIRIGEQRYVWKEPPRSGTELTQLAESHGGALGMHQINPLQKYRKVPAGQPGPTGETGNCYCKTNAPAKWQTQEVFKEAIPPGSTSHCVDRNGVCLRSQKIRIRSMQNRNGDRNTNFNHNYKQYLQSKCKTLYQNSFNFSLVGTEARGQCAAGGTDCSYNKVTYKPNNSKFSNQGAVTSSTRLVRLKHDTAIKVAASQGISTRVSGLSAASIPHNMVKSHNCRVAPGRIFRSGGCGIPGMPGANCPDYKICCPSGKLKNYNKQGDNKQPNPGDY